MKTLTVFGDAQAAGATVLRDALASRVEEFAQDVTVGTKVPADRSPELDRLPYVMVRKDSDSPHSSMANSRVTLRVTVWHKDDDQAHDLAMLCQGLLIVHSGPVIRGVRPGTGPIAAVDDVSDNPLSTFTVLANVKPRLG
ncbi:MULTISPECIES: hypothetical protein [Streptomyces]|uniref:Tail terminator n=1 Tax=Streptomyces europaeiscabiei TaxID=146819 RepID=A0ABU4NUG6_9ACTN|nr:MULTISPECIES: hypothetical protein [Streptomyces]MBP5922181.1 hypothetical protein [Streptomyces sp. LBUM 1483]MDX3555186.1 hypothetical protein [Streptomyces europaeiscabiei]MDX3705200.1 hypothetical protein [Streptomyces europaeiscabiei]MDX3864389.1 hypothetical protein [Streptomyces europaeiscabiei]MDX3871529.1 hypothetical protein [Streptomyces europaeiscabiei]